MKKLLIAVVCISAAITMSSCTTDGIEDTEKETSNDYNKLTTSTNDEVTPNPVPIDDRDKTKS